MRAMNLTRVATAAGLAATFALCACGSDETIVAVNFDFDGVGSATSIALEINQSGSTVSRQLTNLATTTSDDGVTTLNSFYERVAVPESWSEAPATVRGTLLDPGGATVYVNETVVTIQPGGAVAAFLSYPPKTEEPEPEPDPTGTGGTGGTGGDGNTAGMNGGGEGGTAGNGGGEGGTSGNGET